MHQDLVRPDGHLARLLSHAHHHVTVRLGKALAAHDVSVPEWWVLTLLADGAGHPMSEIATFAVVPPPTLTRIVDRMATRNLVHRRADDLDRRRVLVHATSRGHALHHRLKRDVARYERELDEDFDRAGLIELLDRLIRVTGPRDPP